MTDPEPPAPYVHWHGAPWVHVGSAAALDAAIDRAAAEPPAGAPRAVSLVPRMLTDRTAFRWTRRSNAGTGGQIGR